MSENYIRTSECIPALFDQTTQRRHPTLYPLSGLYLYQKMTVIFLLFKKDNKVSTNPLIKKDPTLIESYTYSKRGINIYHDENK